MVGVGKGAAQRAAGGRQRRHLAGRPAWRRRDSRAEVVGKVCGWQSRGGNETEGQGWSRTGGLHLACGQHICMGDQAGSPVLSGAAPSRVDTLAGGPPLPPPPLPGAAIAIAAAALRTGDGQMCVLSLLVQFGNPHREAMQGLAAATAVKTCICREEGRAGGATFGEGHFRRSQPPKAPLPPSSQACLHGAVCCWGACTHC
jgi:hypothetical protein